MKKGRPKGTKNFSTDALRQEAFWKRVAIRGLDQCWNWTGYQEPQTGYGKFLFDKRVNGAHRYSYRIVRGPIPEGMLVCHSCDNRLCQNPVHLFAGTYTDNNRDMFSKGRGSKPPSSAKSTPEQVKMIRSMWIPQKVTMRMISEKLGISVKRVESAIRKWEHVT